MKPTVGRNVYYKSYGSPNGEYPSVDRAAIITAVNSDTNVDLCVLNPEGMYFNRGVEQGQDGGHWDWPPFQKAVTPAPKAQGKPVLAMPHVEMTSIIVNGTVVSTPTVEEYEKKGYMLLSNMPASRFHPYALDSDRILFFSKPIDKDGYDEWKKSWGEENGIAPLNTAKE